VKKYLLPCNCGQKAEVDSSQAGLTIQCGCGAALEVPTMRGLSQLQVVEAASPSETAGSAWGPGQGLIFLGIVIGLGGLLALGLVLQTRPQWRVHPEQIDIHVDKLSVEQLWQHWLELHKGLGSDDDPIRKRFESEWSTYRRRMSMSAIPAALGLLMIIGGLVLKRNAARPRRHR
jgi:hypothetical protein